MYARLRLLRTFPILFSLRIDEAIQVRSNVDPTFYSLVGSGWSPLAEDEIRYDCAYFMIPTGEVRHRTTKSPSLLAHP
ncbi:hypothetical protein Dsin_027278 [Dipteronia sinensis]|uniref:Uncharacterized protein ycf68 n=1 Tax=Dipteronia sinensis TaxID=43782 RepID=A0AAD9ZPM0_9ROSI|nr:hypothetical protein Dsin_027278 [Dipteronia sinensis]